MKIQKSLVKLLPVFSALQCPRWTLQEPTSSVVRTDGQAQKDTGEQVSRAARAKEHQPFGTERHPLWDELSGARENTLWFIWVMLQNRVAQPSELCFQTVTRTTKGMEEKHQKANWVHAWWNINVSAKWRLKPTVPGVPACGYSISRIALHLENRKGCRLLKIHNFKYQKRENKNFNFDSQFSALTLCRVYQIHNHLLPV